MFEFKPDLGKVLDRYEAWWRAEILDRALVSITFPQPEDRRVPVPASSHADLRERWFDAEFQARRALASARNTVYCADALPVAMPNLGPDFVAALYGAPLVFAETTSWSEPVLDDLDEETVAGLRMDLGSEIFRKMMELTDACLEVGSGRFIVGYTDLHGPGDTLAALRDPQNLAIDMIERPEAVEAACAGLTTDLLELYDAFHEKLGSAGMPSTTWLHATGRGKFHVPSNDFSCMVSEKMFDEVFLAGIERECAHMDYSIYHLDGPAALRHLDSILDVAKLNGVQWVPGAGRTDWHEWIDVYRRLQARRKCFPAYLDAADVREFTGLFRPEGVWLNVWGVDDRESADAVLGIVSRWTAA